MRYTGGMVPDVNQMLVKGKGVFVNVESKKTKSKLRLLYVMRIDWYRLCLED